MVALVPGARSREALLQSAIALAGVDGSLTNLSLEQVAVAAAVSPLQVQQCFADLPQFQRALLLHLLDLARAVAIETMTPEQAGLERVRVAFTAYLDANLKYPGLRELARHLRDDPEAVEALRARARGVALLTSIELKVAGWVHPEPAAAARMLTAMMLDIASSEYEARAARPELRRAMLAYLDLTGTP